MTYSMWDPSYPPSPYDVAEAANEGRCWACFSAVGEAALWMDLRGDFYCEDCIEAGMDAECRARWDL